MTNTTVCLAAYGVVVAVLAPRLLVAQAGSGRAPRLGVLGWFVAVATVLLSWLAAAATLYRSEHAALRYLAAITAAAILARLAWSVTVGLVASRRRRRRQRDGLAVLGLRDEHLGVTVVDSPEAMVYCLPGTPETVVVTTGARAVLSPMQLRAVLTHERAHLAGRHAVALAAAYALAKALPWLTLFRRTGEQVAQLLEMCADDVAARRFGSRTVAAALAAMTSRPAPVGAVGATGPQVLARARRLCSEEPAWRRHGGRLAIAVTVTGLAIGPYLAAVLPFCPHPLW
jgi:Zn-dependent protease with chaperone function